MTNYDAMAKQIAAVIQWTKKIINTTAIQIKFYHWTFSRRTSLCFGSNESKYGTDAKALLELY
jgi:hypothetical protein